MGDKLSLDEDVDFTAGTGSAGYGDMRDESPQVTYVKTNILRMSLLELSKVLADKSVRKAIMDALDKNKIAHAKEDHKELLRVVGGDTGKVKKKLRRPFWLHTVERIDTSKPGAKQVEGDWINHIDKECDEGEIVMAGLRVPIKSYAILRARPEMTCKLFGDVRTDIEILGAEVLFESKNFASAVAHAKSLLEMEKPDT